MVEKQPLTLLRNIALESNLSRQIATQSKHPLAPHNVHSKTLLGGFFLALRDVSHQKLARLSKQENCDLWPQFAAFNFSAERRQRRRRNKSRHVRTKYGPSLA